MNKCMEQTSQGIRARQDLGVQTPSTAPAHVTELLTSGHSKRVGGDPTLTKIAMLSFESPEDFGDAVISVDDDGYVWVTGITDSCLGDKDTLFTVLKKMPDSTDSVARRSEAWDRNPYIDAFPYNVDKVRNALAERSGKTVPLSFGPCGAIVVDAKPLGERGIGGPSVYTFEMDVKDEGDLVLADFITSVYSEDGTTLMFENEVSKDGKTVVFGVPISQVDVLDADMDSLLG